MGLVALYGKSHESTLKCFLETNSVFKPSCSKNFLTDIILKSADKEYCAKEENPISSKKRWRQLREYIRTQNHKPCRGSKALDSAFLSERIHVTIEPGKNPVCLYSKGSVVGSNQRFTTIKEFFTIWREKHSRRLSFKEYMENEILPSASPIYVGDKKVMTLKILTEVEKKETETTLVNGRLTQNGKPLNNGKYIFVLSREGKLFVHEDTVSDRQIENRIHHSIFTDGGPVNSAGILFIQDEKIKITMLSGHYQPGILQAKNILVHLKRIGLNLSSLEIVMYQAGKWKPYNASIWLEGSKFLKYPIKEEQFLD